MTHSNISVIYLVTLTLVPMLFFTPFTATGESVEPFGIAPAPTFYNTPATVGSLQDQDIYGATMYLTGYFSPYIDMQAGAQFNLGFTNSTPGLYTLAVLMNVDPSFPNSTARVVWEANRHDPVRFNASLNAQPDGDLVLRDADGRFVWSTGTGGKNVTSIQVLDSGNLVVMSNAKTVWQSFDHPSDTLLDGQLLQPGAVIRSRKSRTDSSPGDYMLVMEPGGLVLYTNTSGSQQPYWIRSYSGVNTLDAARHPCGSRLVSAVLDGTGLSLSLNMQLTNVTSNVTSSLPVTPCSFSGTRTMNLRDSNIVQNVSFIRLEYDGNLRVYTIESRQYWSAPYQMIDDSSSCSLPQKCQPFGICTAGVCTACLSSDGVELAWNSSCSAPRVDACTDTESLRFLQVPGTEYFSSKFLNSSVMSFDECRSRCLQSCSCSAFHYWEDKRSCFFTSEVGTLEKVPNQLNHVAYIKANRVAATNTISSSSTLKLSGGAIAGTVIGASLVGVLVVILLLLFWSKSRNPIEAVNYDSDNFLESIENLRPIRFTHEDLQRITDNFSRVLGAGGFGGVYEGVLPDGRKVAVKKLESSGQGKKEFYAEVAVLGTLHHWNLVKLLGFCSDGSNRLLVYEHMTNGSLDKWIYIDNSEPEILLSWTQRMEVMLGMARGLAYLHEECMQRIIHLDIKPQNILLDEAFVAKVADFGLSRLMGREESFVMTTMRGTPGYLAPEWLLEGAITEKSDVYSFGVVMLEIISGKRTFSRASGSDEKFYLPAHALELVKQGRELELLDPRLRVDSVMRLKDFEAAVPKCVRLALQCLHENGSSRPSMGNVVKMLEGSLDVKPVEPSVQGMLLSLNPADVPRQINIRDSVLSTSFSLSAR